MTATSYLVGYIIINKVKGYYYYDFPKSLKIMLFVMIYYVAIDLVMFYSNEILSFLNEIGSFLIPLGLIGIFIYSITLFINFIENKSNNIVSENSWKKLEFFSRLFISAITLVWLVIFFTIISKIAIGVIGVFISIMIIPVILILLFIIIGNKLLTISPKAKKLEKNLDINFSNRNLLKGNFYALKNKYFISLSNEGQKAFDKIISKVYYELEINSLYNKTIHLHKLINSSSRMKLFYGTYKKVLYLANHNKAVRKPIMKRWLNLISQDMSKALLIKTLNTEFKVTV